MSRISTALPAILLVAALAGRAALAQEFRVYTAVYNEGAAAADPQASPRPEVVARSVSLFRAGKVYDYIDTVGEVIIFEPAHRRFTLLNTSREMASTVHFEELHNLLKVARHETESYLDELKEQGDPASLQALDPLRFQLDPSFDEHYDPSKKRLTLSSRHLRYEAVCAGEESRDISPEKIEAYLRYADWMCRLNYVLQPGMLFPAPRLAFNASLREKGLIPLEVELQSDIDGRMHLRAEHKIHHGTLDAKDRSLIHQWEKLLKNKKTEWKPFPEYQRAMLVSPSAQRR